MHNTNPESAVAQCPVCSSAGRPVKAITIESLVTEAARARLRSPEGFRFCSAVACNVAYFNNECAAKILRSEVSVPIGQKEDGTLRTICYCFEHTAEEIAEQVLSTGSSTIADDIATKCKQGLQRCEQTNPQGSCCLGNVRQVITSAQARSTTAAADSALVDGSLASEDCCSSTSAAAESTAAKTSARRSTRSGRLATGGALLAAALSSACCWLPLLLIGLGTSSVGFAALVEPYRPYFLGVAALSLSAGFYFVYKPHETCAVDGSCAEPNPRRDRLQKISLWVSAVFVVGFAVFPNSVGLFLGEGGTSSAVETPATGESRLFRVDGMTCEACAVTLRETVMDVPGVAAVEISFEAGSARVSSARDMPRPTDAAILEAIQRAGYEGRQMP